MLHGALRADLPHALEKLALLVAKTVGLVDNSDAKRNLINYIEIADKSIIRCHQNIKLEELCRMRTIFEVPFVLSQHITPYALSVVIYAADHVGPTCKLAAPVLDGRKRDHHQKRPSDFLNTE